MIEGINLRHQAKNLAERVRGTPHAHYARSIPMAVSMNGVPCHIRGMDNQLCIRRCHPGEGHPGELAAEVVDANGATLIATETRVVRPSDGDGMRHCGFRCPQELWSWVEAQPETASEVVRAALERERERRKPDAGRL